MTSLRLRRDHSQVLLIDVQERLIPAIEGAPQVVAAAECLAQIAHRLGVPVTISEQYPKGLGATLGALHTAAGDTAVTLAKVEFSCLANAALATRLRGLADDGRAQVVVAGVEAHICVLQTALDLLAWGLKVFVAADAVGSRRAASKALALARLTAAGATILDAEMAAYEWLERAGTSEFREIQALLK